MAIHKAMMLTQDTKATFETLRVPLPILLLLCTVIYLAIGALLIAYIETPGGKSEADLEFSNQLLNVTFPNVTCNCSAITEEGGHDWSFGSAFLFTFSIVTTIGYGHIVPVTVLGQFVTLVFSLIGIPLGYLGLANIGRLLNEAIVYCHRKSKNWRRWRRNPSFRSFAKNINDNSQSETSVEQISTNTDDEELEALTKHIILISFVIWNILGVIFLPLWETSLTRWEAAYFTFISLTTIGFGDIRPLNYPWFPLTYVFLMIGLVITTMMIDVLAEYLRRIQYFGRRIPNPRKQVIWIGDKRITVGTLLTNVAAQLPLSEEDMTDLLNNLDNMVDNACDPTYVPPLKLGPKTPTMPNSAGVNGVLSRPVPVRPESFQITGNRFDSPSTLVFFDDQTTLRQTLIRGAEYRDDAAFRLKTVQPAYPLPLDKDLAKP